ncbi:hypothetical protein BH20CHL2_BH20CHL2_08240 [soil metagenome]
MRTSYQVQSFNDLETLAVQKPHCLSAGWSVLPIPVVYRLMQPWDTGRKWQRAVPCTMRLHSGAAHSAIVCIYDHDDLSQPRH